VDRIRGQLDHGVDLHLQESPHTWENREMSRNPRRWLILAAAVAAGWGAGARLAAQEPKEVELAEFLDPMRFHQEVETTRSFVEQHLESPSSRRALARAVQAYVGGRLLMEPAGDERMPGFTEALRKSYQVFARGVGSLDRDRLRSLNLSEFDSLSFDAFRSNFSRLMEAKKNTLGGPVSDTWDETRLRSVLAFSLVLYAVDREQWHTASGWTGVWPLCSKRR
jgi:hypothetical protein